MTPDAGSPCDYCGLPIHDGKPASSEEPRYCCFGCRFAASVAGETSHVSAASGTQLRLGLAVFFAMNVMVFTMFLWSQPEQVNDATAAVFYDLARYLCLLFSIPVVLLLGPALVQDAAAGIKTGRLTASLLLLVGVGASFIYSIGSVIQESGHVYFEVGVMVLVLVTVGRWLEAEGKLRTTRSLRELQHLLPDKVRLLCGGRVEEIDRCSVQVGDPIQILAGERIAIDGCVVSGRATVDEQFVTGEAVPVEKDPGETVYSGTFNLDGELIVTATSTAAEGTWQRLVDAVLQAVGKQNTFQRLADRVAAWLLPLVAVIAVLTCALHMYLEGEAGSPAFAHGLQAALAVLVIACPCALGLATPMTLWAAITRAAGMQVLFRDGDTVSRLAMAKVVCFDKTGTLTTGQLEVLDRWVAPDVTERLAEHVTAAIAGRSRHPVAKAVGARMMVDPRLIDLEAVLESPGRGVSAWCPSLKSHVIFGSWRWLQENDCDAATWLCSPKAHSWEQHALAYLAIGGKVAAVFALCDEIRPETKVAIDALRALGLKLRLLTGDRQSRAAAIAAGLGLEYEAELLPSEKLLRIQQLRRKFGPVVMVGDGLNDAPALAAADCGIAMGCGADVSRDAAAVCLLGSRLDRIPWSIELARETSRSLRWNLVWAFGYNAAAIPLAALGIVNPIVAAVAMAASSLFVIANSLRLVNAGSEEEQQSILGVVNRAPSLVPTEGVPS